MCVCRNNGLHSCLVLIVIMLFICRNKRLWAIVLAAALSVFIYQGPLMKAFNVDTSTTIREMLSLPLQQMAYAYKNKANNLSDADRQAMQEYAPEWNWENDLTGISDTIKSGIDTNKIMENPEKFFRMYITIGHKAPKDYIFGTLYQTIGLWYPEKHYSDPQIWHPYLNVQSYDINKLDFWKSSADIRQISLFPQYLDVIKYLFGWDNEAYAAWISDRINNHNHIVTGNVLSVLCTNNLFNTDINSICYCKEAGLKTVCKMTLFPTELYLKT